MSGDAGGVVGGVGVDVVEADAAGGELFAQVGHLGEGAVGNGAVCGYEEEDYGSDVSGRELGEGFAVEACAALPGACSGREERKQAGCELNWPDSHGPR